MSRASKVVRANRQHAFSLYARALERWPKDTLRPDDQIQDVLRRRVQALFTSDGELRSSSDPLSTSTSASSSASSSAAAGGVREMKQASAAMSLVDDRYRKLYPLRGHLMQPQSQPAYFEELAREIEQAPKRSFLDQMWLRMKGRLRFD